jgi:hypothetical protein
MQPEAEVTMARGGLAGIPVRRDMFEYAGGGIIAFAEAGSVEDPRRERKQGENFADFRKRMFALDLQLQQEKNAAEESGRESERQRRIAERGEEFTVPPSPFVERPPLPQAAREPLVTSQGPGMPIAPRRPIESAGLPEALKNISQPAVPAAAPPRPSPMPSAPMPSAPRPAPTQASVPAVQGGLPAALTGAPATQSVNQYEARLNQAALKEPVAPTAQDAINRIKELSPEAMQEEFMKKRMQEQRDRAASERAAFEKSRPSGLDDLIRVFGQAGQYKGLSGLAPAYTANKQQQRAEELAMEKRQNELLNAIDAGEYEKGKAIFAARTGAFDTAQQLFGKEKDNVIKATASLYETTQSRINNEMKMLSEKEMQQLKIAADKDIQAMKEAGDTKRTQMQIGAANARDPNAKIAEYVGLKAKARELREKGDPASIKEADRLMARAADIMEYKGGASGAAGERNDISAIKAIQASLQKELSDNLRMDAATRARKQAELDKTYTDLANLGGAGAPASQTGKVVDFSSLPK